MIGELLPYIQIAAIVAAAVWLVASIKSSSALLGQALGRLENTVEKMGHEISALESRMCTLDRRVNGVAHDKGN